MDGTLGAEPAAAQAYQRMCEKRKTPARPTDTARCCAWCDWCAKRDLPPLPACGQDVAAFLAAERRREMDAQHHRSAPCRDPLSAPRRRLPSAHRRCLRLGNCGRDPPRRGGQRPIAGEEGRRHGCDHPATAGAHPKRPARQSATAPCSWSASPARCAARSWRPSGSSGWKRPPAACG